MGIPFDCPGDIIDLLNGVKQRRDDVPASKRQRNIQRCDSKSEKIDEVTQWKNWTDQLGIRLKGMRALFVMGPFQYGLKGCLKNEIPQSSP